LKFLHTNKETLKKSTYQNVNRAEEPEKQKWGAGGQSNGHRGGNAGTGGYDNGRNSGPKKVRRCQVCEGPHATFRCPLIAHEKDAAELKASFEEKGICVKCLFKHTNNECYSWTVRYVCQTREVHKSVCKCESKNGGTKIQNNSSINNTALGSVGFDTEVVTIRNGKKMKQVLLPYASFASHLIQH
jgi:hypothetical protein